MEKLTPVLVVDEIEACLPFWVDRLGFTKTIEIPRGEVLAFVALERGKVEIMYQTRASIADEGVEPPPRGDLAPATVLYIHVTDLADVQTRLSGIEPFIPERKTFYGTIELGVREPAGNLVLFAQRL